VSALVWGDSLAVFDIMEAPIEGLSAASTKDSSQRGGADLLPKVCGSSPRSCPRAADLQDGSALLARFDLKGRISKESDGNYSR